MALDSSTDTGVPDNYHVKTLPAIPKLGPLYGRGAVSSIAAMAKKGALELPNIAYEVTDVPTTPLANELRAYQQLVGEPVSDTLPSGFLHVLAFPLATAVMVRTDFPLPLLGMVHLANDATLFSPVHLGDVLEVRAWTENLRSHRRGAQVDIVAEIWKLPPADATADPDGSASVQGASAPILAWWGVSTYLAKGVKLGAAGADGDTGTARFDDEARYDDAGESAGVPVSTTEADEKADWMPPHPTARWRLASKLGREYGAISGDRNPIHMSALSAKAFGFPRAIAHGMYTAARALAETGAGRGDTYRWTVEFAKPVLLPSIVDISIKKEKTLSPAVKQFDYVGWNAAKKIKHFSGTVTPI